MTLKDVFNAETELEFEGVKYLLKEPTLLHQGQYQAWLEQMALDAITRGRYSRESDREIAIANHSRDCATGLYEWGGELCIKRLMTVNGLAKILEIICRDQGMSERTAIQLVNLEYKKIIATFAAKATSDPKALEAILAALGLPSDFLSSNSQTRHSTTESTTSAV